MTLLSIIISKMIRAEGSERIEHNMSERIRMNLISKHHKPSYSNEHAAGLDLRVSTEEKVEIKPLGHYLVRTGVHVQIPEGYFGLVAIRSGLGMKGLTLSNSIGVIDEDYRGEVRIPLFNHGEESLILEDGERVAQMILIPYVQADLHFVDELEESERGNDGFGSSGRF